MSSLKFKEVDSKKNRSFLNKAFNLAGESELPDFKHGAIIVKNGNQIGSGINALKNNPKSLEPGYKAFGVVSVHAEIAAIRSCKKSNLEGATIYVARMGKNGAMAMSRPCENCQKALKEAGIKKVFYTIDSSMNLD